MEAEEGSRILSVIQIEIWNDLEDNGGVKRYRILEI